MQTYCDRCNEEFVDHPIQVAKDAEVGELARDLGYRTVCSGCYDDLLAEAAEVREHQADDRRSETRVRVAVPLHIFPTDGDPLDAVTEDISLSGLQVRAVRELEVGSVVRIATGDNEVDAVAIVEVVWHDDDALRAGLRLVEASDTWARLVTDYA
jgi:hypothetical protein